MRKCTVGKGAQEQCILKADSRSLEETVYRQTDFTARGRDAEMTEQNDEQLRYRAVADQRVDNRCVTMRSESGKARRC